MIWLELLSMIHSDSRPSCRLPGRSRKHGEEQPRNGVVVAGV